MKDSKLFKFIAYFVLATFIPIFAISAMYIQYDNSLNNTENINQDDAFTSTYMKALANYASDLIYDRGDYKLVNDNNNKIFYYNTDKAKIQNLCVLIKYKNIAMTNVELTSETDTIQKLQEYINKQDSKKTTIINGKVTSDTDAIYKKAVQYFDRFNFNYYLTQNSYTKNFIIADETTQNAISITDIETSIDDFQIYSSYDEIIVDNSSDNIIENWLNQYSQYKDTIYMLLPISILLISMCIIYLIIAIGHNKGKDEIVLSSIDKMYYELVFFVVCLVLCIPLVLIEVIGIGDNLENLRILITFGVTSYILIYVSCAVLFHTTVKRLKAKSFIKTTFTGKLIIWIWNKIKKYYNKIKVSINNLKLKIPRNRKIVLYSIIYVVVAIILISIFDVIGFCIDVGILAYIIMNILQYANSYDKIENKLKDMYEGKNEVTLSEYDVCKEFKPTVKYINDISNGFENAIEESMKSERMKTELITNVSHDIKTPLTSIINYVDLLKEEKIDNEKAIEYIGILDNKSQRLKKLIEDLVEASKASSGAIKLNIEKINLNELLNQAIAEFEDKFKKKELEIVLDFDNKKNPNSPIYINADSRYVYRVVENLFGNISKYALENSRVYVEAKKNDNTVKIIFKNISKDKLNISSEELMQRFVRGDKSRTTEGSGLGLSIAQSLVELQNGKFSLQIDGDLFKVEIEF